MSGQWPPEWDDPEDIPGEADQLDTEAETGLSAVAAYLASVPAPVMPGSVEARISAALAVESAARAGLAAPASDDATGDGSVQPGGGAGARVLGPAPTRARVRRPSGRERRQERERRKIFEPRRQRDAREVLGKFVIGPLAVCLLIVIIALGLSRVGSSSSSSSSAGSLSALPAAGAAASSAPASGNRLGKSSAASGAVAAAPASSAAASAAASAPLPETGGPDFAYVVTHSGTSYQPATLARQARALVLAVKARESVPSAAPTATSASSAASATSAPQTLAPQTFAPQTLTVQLRECILKVTGGMPLVLVDRATYQGTPAYVIASSSHVWVVGLGCTAARPQVMASVPLAG